jgi:hypothetical protein
MRRPLRAILAVAVVGGCLAAGTIAWMDSGGSEEGSYLSQSEAVRIGGPSSTYFQRYLRGTEAFVSTPQFTNSADSALRDLTATPVIVGSCRIHILFQATFQANSGRVGYIAGGAGPAPVVIHRFLQLARGRSLSRHVFGPKSGSGWFDAFTFTVPSFCRVRISGFDTTYDVADQHYTEFISDPVQFLPSARL